MENIIESYNKVDLILKKLLLCTEKEEVDALFEENHITDYSVRSVLLNKCMGVISTFETPEKITEKERYELDKFAFVEGTKETVRLDDVIKNYKEKKLRIIRYRENAMNGMISSIDFAKYILKYVKTLNEKRSEPITMNETKLHKLMYICDGLLLASNKNVINETAHAWNYGPVYPKVHVWVSKNKPFNSNIDVPQNVLAFLEGIKVDEIVIPVIERMGVYTAGQLSNWSHRPGSPWEKALERNNGIMNGIINKKDMKEYFSRQENND